MQLGRQIRLRDRAARALRTSSSGRTSAGRRLARGRRGCGGGLGGRRLLLRRARRRSGRRRRSSRRVGRFAACGGEHVAAARRELLLARPAVRQAAQRARALLHRAFTHNARARQEEQTSEIESRVACRELTILYE